VIDDNFQGKIQVTCETGGKSNTTASKFYMLSLDLPTVPLFKEQTELASLPQIGLSELLKRYDGKTRTEKVLADNSIEKKQFKLMSVPNYLIVHVKRFSENNFFKEKNPTIVNFPLTNLDLTELGINAKYDLLANVVHTGKADSGSYCTQVLHGGEWFEVQDLLVSPIISQQVTVSETYIMLYAK